MPVLQRLTTSWIASEDRIRLAGECTDGGTVCLWLTRRLADRMLPLLLKWLEGHAGADTRAALMQEFAQDAARGALAPQAAVPADGAGAVLVQAVDVASGPLVMRLTFRPSETPGEGPSWDITLEQQPLRQWLAIVHDQYCKAGWPLDVWPGWISLTTAQPAAALH